MKFEFYVLNYDSNHKRVERFNIFRNLYVQEWTEDAIRKYLRAPKKYKYIKQYANEYLETEEIAIYGFEALCAELRSVFMNQLWARREYEISVSDAFVVEVRDLLNDIDTCKSVEDVKDSLIKISERNPKLEKWDCFKQIEDNIPVIARECIYQYRQQLKEEKNNESTI